MAVNRHFNHITQSNEQDIIEDMVVEVIQMRGMDLKYIERDTNGAPDYMYSESPLQQYSNAFDIEALLEKVDGFDSAMIISDFGLELSQTATYSISIKRFKEEAPSLVYPRKGDLLYVPVTNSLLEIKDVKDDDPFYQLGKNHVYTIECQLYEYNQEDFNTGDSVVDSLLDDLDTTLDIDNDEFADNNEIETEADDMLPFDVNNPFGTP